MSGLLKPQRVLFGIGLLVAVIGVLFSSVARVQALGSQQNPQNGSVGLEGTVAAPPPTQAATIAVPGNGQTIRSIPTTVSGLCKTGLLVKVFSNNIFVGAAECKNGSYSMQVDLFSGRNDLVARVYDALDQAGPDSNVVSVTFSDAQFVQFGTRVALSSIYARLGAPPSEELVWPITLSGGIGPYAISVDWGDGTAPSLQSQAFPGEFNIKHVYKSAGVYRVIVRATDANGTIAFLQLVGVATGKVGQGANGSGSSSDKDAGSLAQTPQKISPIIWLPIIVMFPLIFTTFWLGRRHELYSLRHKLEKSRSQEQL